MESVMKKTAATSLLASCAVSLALFSSCASQEQNTLTPEEIADGWVLLFDGKTLDGWKDYNGTTLTQPWHVVDGCIQAKGDGSDASGYIVTDKEYENFELSWDWKLSNVLMALGLMLIIALSIIALFNYYYSIARSESFRKRFTEMAVLSFSVAALSFLIGYALKEFTGIDV